MAKCQKRLSQSALVATMQSCAAAGAEDFELELGPWSVLGQRALVAPFEPDFDAVALPPCRLLRIPRSAYAAALAATRPHTGTLSLPAVGLQNHCHDADSYSAALTGCCSVASAVIELRDVSRVQAHCCSSQQACDCKLLWVQAAKRIRSGASEGCGAPTPTASEVMFPQGTIRAQHIAARRPTIPSGWRATFAARCALVVPCKFTM